MSLLNPTMKSIDRAFDRKVANTIPGMAHFAGTGPTGATCGKCLHLNLVSKGRGFSTRCGKYTAMMDGVEGPQKIPDDTPACKYFEKQTAKRKD